MGRTNRPKTPPFFNRSTNHARCSFLPSSPPYLLQSARQYSQNKAVASARDMGMNYLAMTDHAVLYGAISSIVLPSPLGSNPSSAAMFYVARNGIAERKTQRDNMSLVLLAENQTGYNNLAKTRLPSAPRRHVLQTPYRQINAP